MAWFNLLFPSISQHPLYPMNPIVVEFISTENIRTFIECPEIVILKQRGIDMFFNTYGENMTLVFLNMYSLFPDYYQGLRLYYHGVLLLLEGGPSLQ